MARMVSPEMAATLEMAELAAQVRMARRGLTVLLPVNLALMVKPAAMAVRADSQDSAARQAASKPMLAQTVSLATAVTRVLVVWVVEVPPVRMGRFSLQTVRPAEPVAMAGQEAWADLARRRVQTV